MTARQLLSILRLSQGLARLRLSSEISHEDVDEAIRLTHASKASLLDDSPSGQQEDPMSAIFSIIRDFAFQHKVTLVENVQAEAMIVRRGFTAQQLAATLQEYEMLGVLEINADGNIRFL